MGPLVWLALAGLWGVDHRWRGIQYDGILYAAQAMLHLRPDIYAGDLFFAYGSQDKFTIFGRLYAAAVELLGLTWAGRTLWAVSQLMWLLVAVAWVRRLVATKHVLVTAAIVFTLPAYYSSDIALRAAESYLSARSFAEPLALAGLLAVAVGKAPWGIGLVLLAGLFHPIMAMPAAVAAGLLVLERDFGLGWRSVAVVLFAAALTSLLLPAAGLFSRMDAEWFALSSLRNPIVMAGEWRLRDWAVLLYPPLVLTLIGWHGDSKWGFAWRAMATSGLIGLALSLLAWWMRWELGLQAQTWRFLWLAAWAAPLAAMAAAWDASGRSIGQRVVLAATIPAIALTAQGWWAAAWVLPVVHLAALAVYLVRGERDTRAARVAAFFLAALILGAAVLGVVLHVAGDDGGTTGRWLGADRIRLGLAYFSWAVLGFTAWFVSRGNGGRWQQVGTGLFAVAVLAGATMRVDARNNVASNLDRLIDSRLPSWSARIPEQATVFWPHRLRYVWFVLQRRSYVSRYQLAGGIFSGGMLREGRRRMENVKRIGGTDAVLSFREPGASAVKSPPVRADLEHACADPLLDFVVLDRQLAPAAAPSFLDAADGKRFYLYSCAELREGPHAAPGTISAFRDE